mmetsp:Transcript_5930/g.12515  ORF Transcript_5930/g.12515 Transcript_5930/m.12515 type:complete len:114 (-) Transcript_5930:144-485(-)
MAKTNQKRIKTSLICPGLKLNNNFLGFDTEGRLDTFLEPLVFSIEVLQNLRILDLSFNFIQIVPDEIQQLSDLQSLYLHKNLIMSLHEVQKLSKNKNLKSLSLNNNPIEEIDN